MLRKIGFLLVRGLALLAVFPALLLPGATVYAHPVDMYAQSQTILVTTAGLQVDWKITPGPLLADAIWDAADLNHDGAVSPGEAQAWSVPTIAQWLVKIDGRQVANPNVESVAWPATIDLFRTGEDSIHLKLLFDWGMASSGKHTLEIHNTYQEANSLNWFSITSQAPVSFGEPAQNSGTLDTSLSFSPGTPGGTSSLTSWNSGIPTLPGFTGALSNMAAGLAHAPQPQTGGGAPATASTALVGLVKTTEFSGWFLVGALLLSMALGSLHALTPGHGKALVAAYLVGSRGRPREAILLGLIVTLTHTGSVVLLGLLTLLASHYILPSLIAPWLEVISGVLVIVFGINLFVQRRAVIADWLRSRWKQKPAGNVYRLSSGATISLKNASLAGHARPMIRMKDEPAGHGHVHVLPAGEVTIKSLLTLGISGGLVPCPDAIAILLVAVAINRILFGMVLIVAFSIGLALVLIGIGIAMVQGLRFIERSDLLNRFSAYTPLVSAVVVTGLGVGLTLSALNSFTLTAAAQNAAPAAVAAATPQTATQSALFDIQRARLVYLAPDGQNQNQLFVAPLAGGAPLQYTQETSGVAGYAVAPDQKSILYTVIDINGDSALWSIDSDGSHKRRVLDCPQAECVGPVWVPGGAGGKLVYERLNYSQAASTSVFSIWWLDAQSGETKPVFQDQAFPGIAPAFSPDGQWLSYISPLNNTIQLYSLKGARNLSIALPLGYQPRIQQPWDPLGGAILYWGPISAAAGATLHVKSYNLASGQSLDLSAPGSEVQFEASWSPDGQWVAIARDSSTPDAPHQRQQIWLVHPDGTQGHMLVEAAGVSYSNLSWSADSRFLAYCRYPTGATGKPEIWLAELANDKQTLLKSGGILPALLP